MSKFFHLDQYTETTQSSNQSQGWQKWSRVAAVEGREMRHRREGVSKSILQQDAAAGTCRAPEPNPHDESGRQCLCVIPTEQLKQPGYLSTGAASHRSGCTQLSPAPGPSVWPLLRQSPRPEKCLERVPVGNAQEWCVPMR